MKNLKLFYLTASILLSSLVYYSCSKDSSRETESKGIATTAAGLGTSCTDLGGCTVTERNFKILGVPGYPGCSFNVNVKACEFFGVAIIQEFQIIGYTCQTYADSLTYIKNTPSTLDDKDFDNRTNALLLSKIEDYYFGLFTPVVQCDDGKTFSVSSVSAQCKSICYFNIIQDKMDPDTIIIIGGGGLDGASNPENTNIVNRTGKPLSISSGCTKDGCCRRETTMCYDPETRSIKKTTINTVLGTPRCSGASSIPVYDPKFLELLYCTPCQFSCPK